MARLALLVVIVGACGSSSAPVRAPEPAVVAGGACPAADQVVVLRWMTETDDGNQVAPGWRAFVSNRALDHNDGPAYQTLAAAPPGGAALPSAVTIYQGGVAPCRATATKPFRMVTNVGPVSEQIGVELTGCAAPAAEAPQEAFGLIGAGPGACAFTMVEDVALRAADADDHWQVKPGETPLPAELAAALGASPHACAAPACEALWYARGAGTLAYDVVQTWIKPGTGDACAFEHDDATTILVRGASGLAALPAADIGNQSLVGVFHDAGGARLAVLEDVGEFTVITLGASAPAVHRVWFDKNEEDSNWRSLAPYCGP